MLSVRASRIREIGINSLVGKIRASRSLSVESRLSAGPRPNNGFLSTGPPGPIVVGIQPAKALQLPGY